MITLIIGPTASGKSYLAMQIARKKNGCIINMDSMQIYKQIPIITAQPTQEEQKEIPHHLYGFAANEYNFSFGKWLKMAKKAILQAQEQNTHPIIVGGTMLYAYMLLNGYSDIPEISDALRLKANQLYEEIGHEEFLKITQEMDKDTLQDKQRLTYNYCLLKETGKSLQHYQSLPLVKPFNTGEIEIIIPQKTRQEVYETCNSRFACMLKNGLLEEIASVKKHSHLPIKRATGFKYVAEHLENKITESYMVEKCQQETRNYAKRQITWLRKLVLEGYLHKNTITKL